MHIWLRSTVAMSSTHFLGHSITISTRQTNSLRISTRRFVLVGYRSSETYAVLTLLAGTSELSLSNPLDSVNLWLQQFLTRCDGLPESVIVEDTRFWAELPKLVHALFRHR